MLASAAARLLQTVQRAAQGFDFAFVTELLPLGQFDKLEHFLHLPRNLLQRIENLHHFLNGPVDGGGILFNTGGGGKFLFRRRGLFNQHTGGLIGGLIARRGWRRTARAAPASAAVAAVSSAVQTFRRRGLI